ncbi:uncharacterized protein LOC104849948 [Fukomys damarensis]|uniref:uncharacterized protein LOC104849948 n=1 Tax=Fukomys damarensis TaxID=885580 RepID=UPI00053F3E93|nr:uncharacterized protein LOC104849948 [Fukomys damarensis]
MQGEACLDSPQPKRAGSPGRSCGKPVTAECPRRRRCWSDSPPRPHVCGRHWCAVHTTFSEQVSLTPLAGEETGSLRPNGPSHPAPARKPRVAPACLALGSSSESAEWFPSPLVLEKAEEQLASPGGEVFSKRIQEKAGLREEENTAREGERMGQHGRAGWMMQKPYPCPPKGRTCYGYLKVWTPNTDQCFTEDMRIWDHVRSGWS